MFKTQVEVSGFNAKFWTFYGIILWSTRIKNTENCCQFFIYNNMDKALKSTGKIGFIFCWESARITSDNIFIACTLIDNRHWEFWWLLCKTVYPLWAMLMQE